MLMFLFVLISYVFAYSIPCITVMDCDFIIILEVEELGLIVWSDLV